MLPVARQEATVARIRISDVYLGGNHEHEARENATAKASKEHDNRTTIAKASNELEPTSGNIVYAA